MGRYIARHLYSVWCLAEICSLRWRRWWWWWWRRRRWQRMKQMSSSEWAFNTRTHPKGRRMSGSRYQPKTMALYESHHTYYVGTSACARVCMCWRLFACAHIRLTDTLLPRCHLMGPKSTSKITLDASYFFSMSDRDYFLFILLCTFARALSLRRWHLRDASTLHAFWQIYLF